MSDAARAVVEYTGAVIEELKNPLLNPPLKPPFSEGGSKDIASARHSDLAEGGSKDSLLGGSKDGVVQNVKVQQRQAQKVFSLGDIRLYECPVSYISRDTVEVMRLVYLIDDSKSLLYGGGWGSQPAWLVEALEVFRMETVRRTREREEG